MSYSPSPHTASNSPSTLRLTGQVTWWALVVCLKILLAICTFGIYPVVFPWAGRLSRWSNVERASRRYATRQAARQRYERRQQQPWRGQPDEDFIKAVRRL